LNSQAILLVAHGQFEKNLIENIAHDIIIAFDYPVQIIESHTDLTEFYDPKRRQYDGNRLLRLMDSYMSPEFFKVIGLFRVDIFIPILTYIFGQAIYKGNTGVVSLYRLRNEQYGMKKDEILLFERFRKVVIHELGHSMGLVHCLVPDCVMRSSTYVEDIDQKKHTFCTKCSLEIEKFRIKNNHFRNLPG
jgi:archaemetzincin